MLAVASSLLAMTSGTAGKTSAPHWNSSRPSWGRIPMLHSCGHPGTILQGKAGTTVWIVMERDLTYEAMVNLKTISREGLHNVLPASGVIGPAVTDWICGEH